MPILAVEQPCYLPNIEFFFKIKYADVFVLADTFQFTAHNNINRARLKTAKGVSWFTVPVLTKGMGRQSINEVSIDPVHNWQRNHYKTLLVNYGMTPYFEQHHSFLEQAYTKKWRLLINLNIHFIEYFSRMLLFNGRMEFGSNLPNQSNRTKRVLEWLCATNCDTYLISKKHLSLIDISIIQKHGFKIQSYTFESPHYHQQFGDFIPHLSIIDLLCNEGPDSIALLTNSTKS